MSKLAESGCERDKLLGDINTIYHELEMKEAELQFALFHGIFEIESGWYNNQYYKTNDGGLSRASYPVPVISVKGYCDIEISFDRITVSTKMKRKTALAYSYDKIMKYDYEAYGVEDYLSDFYHAGLTVQDLKDNIAKSDEKEIGFSFIFSFDVEGKQIFEFAKLLRREGFYD